MKQILVLVLTVSLLGCGDDSQTAAASQLEPTLLFQSGPDSLDPALARSQRARFILTALVGASLMERNEVGEFIPVLAQRAPIPTATGWRIELRPEARWSTTESLKARDFCRGLDLVEAGQAGGLLAASWAGVESYRIESDQVFEVQTKDSGLAVFEQLVTELIALPPDWQPGSDVLAGLGPFKVLTHDASGMHLQRRDSWWADDLQDLQGRFAVPGLRLRFEPDQVRTHALLKSGAVDIAAIDPELLSRFDESEFATMSFDSGAFSFVGFNCRGGPLAEAALRRVLAASAARDLAKLRPLELSPYSRLFSREPPRTLPLVKLRQQLQALNGAAASEPLQLRLLRAAGTIPWCDAFLVHWQERLAQLGVVLVIESLEVKALLERLSAGDFELFVLIWRSASEFDSLRELLHSSQIGEFGRNFSGFADAELDALIETAEGLDTQSQWQATQEAIADFVATEAPITPLFRHRLSLIYRSDRLRLVAGEAGPYWPSLSSP